MCKYSKYTKAAMISLWQSGYSFCEIRKKLPLFGYSDDDVKNAMIKALEEKRERIDEEIKRINEEIKRLENILRKRYVPRSINGIAKGSL